MIIDPKNNNHIFAEEGKGLFRKVDETGPFIEVIFGYYVFNGVARMEKIEDFEERDIPSEPEAEEEIKEANE